MKIAIDAGHGPHTPGKRAPDDSMREYHFNSVTARYAMEQLREYECEVLTTFEDARDVPLRERPRKANAWGADVFISIHANAYLGSKWCGACGIETYVYLSATGKAVTLANVVQRKLIEATELRNRGVKRGDYCVLRETKMPAILVECGFMDNPRELALLKSDTYRRKCAEAITKSIVEVYQLKPKKQTAAVKGEPHKLQQPERTGKEERCKSLQPKIAIKVNDKEVCSGTLAKGRVTAPVRLIAEALGANVGWDSKYALVNGMKITSSHLINGTAQALVREVAEVCKENLHFDNKKKEINITK